MRPIRETEIEKLAGITGVSVTDLTKLNDMRLINEPHAVDLLIRNDYKRLLSSTTYSVRQIISALASHYYVPTSRVTQAMYLKRQKEDICKACGRPVSKSVLKKNNGLCNECCVKSIKI